MDFTKNEISIIKKLYPEYTQIKNRGFWLYMGPSRSQDITKNEYGFIKHSSNYPSCVDQDTGDFDRIESNYSYYKNIDDFKNRIECIYDESVLCKVVHFKKDPYDIYIGRPSKWSNPFSHISDGNTIAKYIVDSRGESIIAYKDWITTGDGINLLNDLHELCGKTLGCWCKPNICHGDILAELVKDKFIKIKKL